MTVAELVAKIVFKTDTKPLKDLRKGLQAASTRLERFAGEAQKAAKKAQAALVSLRNKGVGALKGLATGMAVAGAAAVAAGAAVLALSENVATMGDEVAKTATKLGVTTDELQRLRFAGDRSGASMDVVTQAIREQAKLIDEARQTGITPFTMALDRVGLSLEQLEQASGAEERFGLIADQLRQVTNTSERTALSMKLLGEEVGPQLVPLMLEGSRGIRALGDEAVRLGAVMSEDATKASESFLDTMTNLRARLSGVVTTVGTKLMPVVQDALERFGEWFDNNGDMIMNTLDSVFGALTAALGFLADNVWVLKTLGVLLGVLTTAIGILTAASAVLGTTMLVAFSPILAPILAIGAAIAAMVGAWAAWGPSFAETRDFVIEGINFIIDRVQELVNWLGIAADFSGLQISTDRGGGSASAPSAQSANAAKEREDRELDEMLQGLMAFHRREQAKQPPDPWTQSHLKRQEEDAKALQDHIQELAREAGDAEFKRSRDADKAREVAQATLAKLTEQAKAGEITAPRRGGGRGTPDPFTRKHRSALETRLGELALLAGEAEFARSRDFKAAARVSRDMLRELRRQARRGNLPERRDFQREQEERNREFIEQRAREAGERVQLLGAAAADRAANETRQRLLRQGAEAPTRPRGILDALGIGGLGPGTASPEQRVAATAKIVNFRFDIRQDIDNSFNIDGSDVDSEGLFARIERRIGDIMDSATRGALLDVRDQVEA